MGQRNLLYLSGGRYKVGSNSDARQKLSTVNLSANFSRSNSINFKNLFDPAAYEQYKYIGKKRNLFSWMSSAGQITSVTPDLKNPASITP